MKYYITVNGNEHEVVITDVDGDQGADRLHVEVDGQTADVRYEEVDRLGQAAMIVDGKAHAVSIEGDANSCYIVMAGHSYAVEIEDERERAAHVAQRERATGGEVKSVMPGIVIQLLVAVGDEVEKGSPLLILEAMKMQNEITAPVSARVTAVHVQQGVAVGAGQKLISLE